MPANAQIIYPDPPFAPVTGPELEAYLDTGALAHQAFFDVQTLQHHAHRQLENHMRDRQANRESDSPVITLHDALQHGEPGALKRLDARYDALQVRFWLDLAHAKLMQHGHTPECYASSQRDDFNLRRAFGLRMTFRVSYPDFCWYCSGEGYLTDYDTVFHTTESEPCPECLEKGMCPRCGRYTWPPSGAEPLASDELRCSACDWYRGAFSLTWFANPECLDCQCAGASSPNWPLAVSHKHPLWGWKRNGSW